MNPSWSLTDWQFWLMGLIFWGVIWLVWYLPGRLLLRQINKKFSAGAPVTALSFVIGLVAWTTAAYALAGFGQRWLLPVIMLSLAVIELWKYQTWREILFLTQWRKWRISGLTVILFLGLFIQLAAVFGSGLRTHKGVQLFFTNAEDGMMHLSYIQNLAQHFPPQRPEVAGIALTNYHYWGDLATAELNRVFGLPITHLFFQYLPIFISLLSGYLVFSLIQAWGGTRRTGYLGLFFWYLGGDFDYAIAWILHRDWHWYAAAIDNGADQFLNQPQSFAKVIFLAGLWLLTYYWQHKKTWAWWLTILLFGSLIGFKVYFGLFALGAIGITTLWRTLRKQSNWIEWNGLVAACLLSAVIYLPANHLAGGLSFVPLVWPKLLLSLDHLNWQTWWLRQQTYEATQNWHNIGILNTVAVVVALVAFYGTRLVGFWGLVSNLPKHHALNWAWFWWPMSLLFIFLGLNTTQDPGGLNTFNFIIVVSVPLVLSSAFVMDNWLSWLGWKRWVGLGLTIVVMALTVPRSLHNAAVVWQVTLRQEAAATFTPAALETMDWLAKNTPADAILQAHPENDHARQGAFLAYFPNRTTYLTSTNILGTHGVFVPERKIILQAAVSSGDYASLAKVLKAVNVSYFYVENLKGQRELMEKPDMMNHVVFSNEEGWVISLKSEN